MVKKTFLIGLFLFFLKFFFFNLSPVVLGNDTTCWEIMIYTGNNTDEWREDLGLRYVMDGCSSPPEGCLSAYLGSTGYYKDYDRLFLNIKRDGAVAENYALQYSQKSLNYPKLHAIGFDDFYGFWARGESAGGLNFNQTKLSNIIANTKNTNPNLKFGITLYENELSLPGLDNTHLPSDLRNKIDYIYLFLHYRRNGPNYKSYVETVKQKFPNAKIIAGAYAYDRIDYVPCSQSDPNQTKCTKEEELEYFNVSFEKQVDLLKNCVVEAVLFYPGNFGKEADWKHWDTPRICLPERKQECIDNTKIMRNSALQILNEYKPSLTPSPSSIPILPSPTPTLIPGDVNGDGHVNLLDYSLFISKYGTNDPSCDFNKNGGVDMGDYGILVSNYGK